MGRLTDNDKKFFGVTYGDISWNAFRLVYSSSDEENDKNSLSLYAFKKAFRITLPNIVKPLTKKHYALSWDEETVKRLGRNYYYEVFRKDYGFCYSDKCLHLYYGAFTNSGYDKSSSCFFIPWLNMTHVRYSIFYPNGKIYYSNKNDADSFLIQYEHQQKCPKKLFLAEDYDGEIVTASCYITEREYHLGTGWFKWLRFFTKRKIYRNLEICFDKETGTDKGSWKGGTIGTSFPIAKNQSIEDAFKKFCDAEHKGKHGMYKLKYKGMIDE